MTAGGAAPVRTRSRGSAVAGTRPLTSTLAGRSRWPPHVAAAPATVAARAAAAGSILQLGRSATPTKTRQTVVCAGAGLRHASRERTRLFWCATMTATGDVLSQGRNGCRAGFAGRWCPGAQPGFSKRASPEFGNV